MEIVLIKTLNGFIPGEPNTEKWSNKIKVGGAVHGKFSEYRNLAFHRKYFALLNIAYDQWVPGEINSKYGKPEKNFNRFRKDLTILAGFYTTTIRLDGSPRIEAQSISFAKMEPEEFEKLYSKSIDVLIKYVYKSKMSKEEMEKLVEQYLQFA